MDLEQLKALLDGKLSHNEAMEVMALLTPEKLTSETFAQLLQLMREQCCLEGSFDLGLSVLDCCGTGGTGRQGGFNTSTATAFVLAAGGVKIAKFGNRSATSSSGSSDFLEALDLPLSLDVRAIPEVFAKTGLVFLFAPQFYPTLVGLSALRKQFAQVTSQATAFNFMGPLLNPVQLGFRLLGVSHPRMVHLISRVLATDTTLQTAWVARTVSGDDDIGVDETTQVQSVSPGEVTSFEIPPMIGVHEVDNFSAGSPRNNAQAFMTMMLGDDVQSRAYYQVCRNAAAGFVVAGQCDSIDDGVVLAQELLRQQTVLATYKRYQDTLSTLAH